MNHQKRFWNTLIGWQDAMKIIIDEGIFFVYGSVLDRLQSASMMPHSECRIGTTDRPNKFAQ